MTCTYPLFWLHSFFLRCLSPMDEFVQHVGGLVGFCCFYLVKVSHLFLFDLFEAGILLLFFGFVQKSVFTVRLSETQTCPMKDTEGGA